MIFSKLSLVLFAVISCVSGKHNGQTMAFMDINADTFTDLVMATSPNSISIYVATEKDLKPGFQEDVRFRLAFPNNSRILNVGVGDFDGDSFPDLAVSLTLDDSTAKTAGKCGGDDNGQSLEICFGALNGFRCLSLKSEINGSAAIVYEQPLVLDCDIDQKADLLTTVCHDRRLRFVCFHSANNMTGVFEAIAPFPSREYGRRLIPAPVPTSNAFVDVTGDLSPEIVLWTKAESDTDLVGLEILRLDEGRRWVPSTSVLMPAPPTPEKGKKPKLLEADAGSSAKGSDYLLAQSVFDDFNKDGLIDHLLPFCKPDSNNGGACALLYFDVWIENATWTTMSVALVDDRNQQWGIFLESAGTSNRKTFHVRSGDYTQDGYPDLLIVLEQLGGDAKTEKKRAAFLLENVPCPAGEMCPPTFARTFRIWWNAFESSKDDLSNAVTTASFFDLGEDGTLDVLLEYQNLTTQGPTVMDFATSVFEGDTTFLKIQVFTATCLYCRYGREGSAVSLPGAALVYASSDAIGNTIKGAYTQRSIASYRPLLLPFALFGLGRTPNFVERLNVGVPSWPLRNKSWEQLVPNSRIYVIPYPATEPSKWVHRLYLTPNRLIIYSLIALSSVCGLIIIVVIALHMQERRMDKKERELQKERFHFDAM